MSFEEEKRSSEIKTDNIFEDLSEGLEEDDSGKEELPPEIKKLNLIAKIMLGTTIFFGVVLILSFSYVSFQKSKAQNTFLPSFMCSIFSGDAEVDNSNGCSSITALNETYESKLIQEKYDILKGVLNLIPDTYEVEDFMNSKEIVFLLDKTKNKLRPLEVLEAFDDVKNNFFSVGKSDIECHDFNITKDGELTTNCVIFSYDWQSDINGTSQSLAALFQAEFEKSNDFILLDKQREFSYSPVVTGGPISRKTELYLHLKYEGGDAINF